MSAPAAVLPTLLGKETFHVGRLGSSERNAMVAEKNEKKPCITEIAVDSRRAQLLFE
jgi:hypothetical protein